MIHSFKLTIDSDAPEPAITVEDLTTPGTPLAKLKLDPGSEPPYQLAIDLSDTAQAEPIVRLDEPFDPQVTRDTNILVVESSISDVRFGTRDDTKYILHLKNRSRYYLAEDIHVRAVISPNAAPNLPDGNPSLSLIPEDQHVQCIDPGQTRDVVFVAVSRGPKPDLYCIDVTVAYRLLYWDGRRVRDRSQHLLPVHDALARLDLPEHPQPLRMPRQPTIEPRNCEMSNEHHAFFAPYVPRAPVHHLKPIEQHFDLPGGGSLCVGYRLVKGYRRDQEQVACSYGRHPETKEVESYFSTQDTAILELNLHNHSHHNLKHVRVSNIQLSCVNQRGDIGSTVDQAAPDGNLFFEIVPGDVYYGHLAAGKVETKHLSLITRGVAPGNYAVMMNVNYDIEQCTLPVAVYLTVRPD